eukprot:m.105849 g.105849  ORF g.105849 m.105849 type:complete len:53 (+) comp12665_c0_seq1:6116-6274(+)
MNLRCDDQPRCAVIYELCPIHPGLAEHREASGLERDVSSVHNSSPTSTPLFT